MGLFSALPPTHPSLPFQLPSCLSVRAQPSHRSTPCLLLCPIVQVEPSEERWPGTDILAGAVAAFRSCFLDGLEAESLAGLAAKAREAAPSAQPTLVW